MVWIAAVAAALELVVGPNVLVSGLNRSIPHMEVVACADRARPQGRSTLLVASMASRRSRTITIVYRSTDSGTSWRQVMRTDGPASFGDPTCAFGTDGRAYYGVLSSRGEFPAVRGLRSLATLVYASHDRGATWSTHPATQLLVDRPFLTVDDRGDGAEIVYYTGLAGSESLTGRDPERPDVDDPNVESGVAVLVSTDLGKTFALSAFPRYGVEGDWPYATGNSVVTASGTLISVLRVLKNRFAQPPYRQRPLGDVLSALRVEPGGFATEPIIPIGVVRSRDMPRLAVDRSKNSRFTNRIYAVATDAGAIVVYWSDDEARTWHGPTAVRAASAATDEAFDAIAFNPSIAVNRDGVVAISWAEGTHRKGDPVYLRSWELRMAASSDGGETFSGGVRVSSGRHEAARVVDFSLFAATARPSADRQRGTISVDPFPDGGGHTFDVTADSDGVFHAAWTDNRSGVSQVWTAAVRAVTVTAPH